MLLHFGCHDQYVTQFSFATALFPHKCWFSSRNADRTCESNNEPHSVRLLYTDKDGILSGAAEMVTYLPISSPFITFAGRYIDDAIGLAAGYNFFIFEAMLVRLHLSFGLDQATMLTARRSRSRSRLVTLSFNTGAMLYQQVQSSPL